jgi:hypothetical protein
LLILILGGEVDGLSFENLLLLLWWIVGQVFKSLLDQDGDFCEGMKKIKLS